MVRIAIKNPSPLGPNLEKWGDYHFGLALADALAARGAEVVQHFWPEWDRDDGEDAVIVLRGKRSYLPPPGKLSLMWIISHPGTVMADEMQCYDRVHVASETHYQMVRNDPAIQVDIARQCTDTRVFRRIHDAADRRGVSFVANSRGVKRDVLNWAIAAGVQVSVTGRHWKAFGLQHLVAQEYVSNQDLPAFYGTTRLTLNDHWGDMAHFGYVNNRIFDCLACGTPVLTDHFPELRAVCGDGVLYAQDTASFWDAYRRYLLRYPEVIDNARRLWDVIGSHYSFDARAEQIMDWLGTSPAVRPKTPVAVATDPDFMRVLARTAADLRGRGITRELQCLHLFPQTDHVAPLFRAEEFSYLSAGFGRGPWHLDLDMTLSLLADNHFDLILLDSAAALADLPAGTAASFLAACRRVLSKKGMMVASPALHRLPGLETVRTAPLVDGYVSLA